MRNLWRAFLWTCDVFLVLTIVGLAYSIWGDVIFFGLMFLIAFGVVFLIVWMGIEFPPSSDIITPVPRRRRDE